MTNEQREMELRAAQERAQALRPATASMMNMMYPLAEMVVMGGCDDTECACGGVRFAESITFNPALN